MAERPPRAGSPSASTPVPEAAPSTLLLGLGNPILTDDAVGIYVVRKVAAACPRANVAFAEASVGGLRLLELFAGYDRIIIVDAIQTHSGRPGHLHRLHPNDLQASLHAGSTHDLSLPGALALGRSLGLPLPRDQDITILAVEVDDVLTFGETCTPQVQTAIPQLAQRVLEEVHSSVSGPRPEGVRDMVNGDPVSTARGPRSLAEKSCLILGPYHIL